MSWFVLALLIITASIMATLSARKRRNVAVFLVFALPTAAVLLSSGFSFERRLGAAYVSPGSSLLVGVSIVFSACFTFATLSRALRRSDPASAASLWLLLGVICIPLVSAAFDGNIPATSTVFPIATLLAAYAAAMLYPGVALASAALVGAGIVTTSLVLLFAQPLAVGWGEARGFGLTWLASLINNQRLAGITEHPNSLGYVTAITMVLLWTLRRKLGRTATLALLLVSSTVLIATESRSSILGVGLAALIACIARATASRKQGSAPRFILALFLTGILALALVLTTGLLNDSTEEVAGRATVWSYVEQNWTTSPWIGHGAQSLADQVERGVLPAFAGQAHNQWLDSLFKGGLLAALVLGTLCLLLLAQGVKEIGVSEPSILMLLAVFGARTLYESPLTLTGPSWGLVSATILFGALWSLVKMHGTPTAASKHNKQDIVRIPTRYAL